jgi:allantoinase
MHVDHDVAGQREQNVVELEAVPRPPRHVKLKGRAHAPQRRLLRLVGDTGCAVHVVHLSAAEALEPLAEARRKGLPVTVEPCPHYLSVAAEEVPDGATDFKCAPPIRERENGERLWEGLSSGLIDQVASDHSPAPPELRCRDSGDFFSAWGGISSLQLLLPAFWTQAHRRGHDLTRLAAWTSEAPARLAGLGHRKGRLAPGFDGDLVIWDPAGTFTVAEEALHHRHPSTPYRGRTLRGRVLRTFVRGTQVFDGSGGGPAFPAEPRPGQWLRRGK